MPNITKSHISMKCSHAAGRSTLDALGKHKQSRLNDVGIVRWILVALVMVHRVSITAPRTIKWIEKMCNFKSIRCIRWTADEFASQTTIRMFTHKLSSVRSLPLPFSFIRSLSLSAVNRMGTLWSNRNERLQCTVGPCTLFCFDDDDDVTYQEEHAKWLQRGTYT